MMAIRYRVRRPGLYPGLRQEKRVREDIFEVPGSVVARIEALDVLDVVEVQQWGEADE